MICMKIQFSKAARYWPRQLIRRAGYGEITNRTGEISYVRIFCVGGYPRFHIYIEENETGFILNLHLDQKKPVYAGQTAHNGEYDGAVVEREAQRISAIITPLLI